MPNKLRFGDGNFGSEMAVLSLTSSHVAKAVFPNPLFQAGPIWQAPQANTHVSLSKDARSPVCRSGFRKGMWCGATGIFQFLPTGNAKLRSERQIYL